MAASSKPEFLYWITKHQKVNFSTNQWAEGRTAAFILGFLVFSPLVADSCGGFCRKSS